MPAIIALFMLLGGLIGYDWGYSNAEQAHHHGKRTCTYLPDQTFHCWDTQPKKP